MTILDSCDGSVNCRHLINSLVPNPAVSALAVYPQSGRSYQEKHSRKYLLRIAVEMWLSGANVAKTKGGGGLSSHYKLIGSCQFSL